MYIYNFLDCYMCIYIHVYCGEPERGPIRACKHLTQCVSAVPPNTCQQCICFHEHSYNYPASHVARSGSPSQYRVFTITIIIIIILILILILIIMKLLIFPHGAVLNDILRPSGQLAVLAKEGWESQL